MRSLAAATIFLCLGGSAPAETETDAILARTSDYCVLGVSTGKRLIVRELVFGNAGWQQLRTDGRWPFPAGQHSIVYLCQHYDSMGPCGQRQIQHGQVEVENAGDYGDFYRTNSNYTLGNLQTLPSQLPAYILAVQQIAAKSRAERQEAAAQALQSMLTPQSTDHMAEFERITRLVSSVVQNLHADDIPTLQQMARLILRRPKVIRDNVRGEFAMAIASNYFRPGFDAVRDVAFENSESSWSSEGAALNNLSRIGNRHDLERMKVEAEGIIAAGQRREVLFHLLRAMGELARRCYPENSAPREQLRKWCERICAHPTSEEEKVGAQGGASMALHFIGNAETIALLESFQRAQPPERRTTYDWTIRNIEARLRGEW